MFRFSHNLIKAFSIQEVISLVSGEISRIFSREQQEKNLRNEPIQIDRN